MTDVKGQEERVGNAEEEARRDAVARGLTGEPPAKVAADLGRTDRWVRKWVARYDPGSESWAQERSRAPRTQARKTPEEIESVVLEIRARLMADPWAQVSATAIAWEMDKLGIEPPGELDHVRVRFIPFAEPWRNPVIERFHNSHHRYSILKGVTPDEYEKRLGYEARLLDRDFAPPTSLPRRGLIDFVRIIRSNKELRILGSKIPMPPELVHR